MPLHAFVETAPHPALPRKRGRVGVLCSRPRKRGRVREGIIAAVMLAAFAFAASAVHAADTYPSRPIRLVVGFGAGGPTDIPARFIADKLGTLLGQRVIVEMPASWRRRVWSRRMPATRQR